MKYEFPIMEGSEVTNENFGDLLIQSTKEAVQLSKLPLNKVPPSAIKSIAKVFLFGATKHGPDTWQQGLSFEKQLGSLMRHLEDLRSGIDFDEETGYHQLEHILTRAAMLNEQVQAGTIKDDRIYKRK
jgi:hypothetical protein